MYNDLEGKENHLVKLDKRYPHYKPPAKEDPLEPVPKGKKTEKEFVHRRKSKEETED